MSAFKLFNRFSFKYYITGVIYLLLNSSLSLNAQTTADTSKKVQSWNFHFQNTEISEYHPAFHAKYSGFNSLDTSYEFPTSVTATIFFGVKLWKGAEAYFNPELSGGRGFSSTTGIAAYPNGEIYRVNDPAPNPYVARLLLKQVFALSSDYEFVPDDLGQIATMMPKSYIAVYAGRYSVMDYFDDNRYSHDPRTQFYNWVLMGNGAWDYPANTRGYTYGITVELVKPQWALRFCSVMVPLYANGWVMDPDILRSHSEALEFEHKYSLGGQQGVIRLMSYLTESRMGNYDQAIAWGIMRHQAPAVDSTRALGRSKYGFGVNVEQPLGKNSGMFLRLGWNDGHNETWEFTEVDRHLSLGFTFNGASWHRGNDIFGIAQIIDGLSKDHRDYLEAGGYGFIIGDGHLNYRPEYVTEMYYSFKLPGYPWWLSPDFQLVINPAYNNDRGPVIPILGMRSHVEF